MESTKERFDSLIYTDFESYIALSDGDKEFFDKLFKVLIYYGEINWSNRKLSELLGTSESTLEKRLSRLEARLRTKMSLPSSYQLELK